MDCNFVIYIKKNRVEFISNYFYLDVGIFGLYGCTVDHLLKQAIDHHLGLLMKMTNEKYH